MNANVNIEEVKKFNATLKQYKDSAAQLNAQRDYITKEISNKCAELTKELGVEVTPDNIEQVYTDLCNKINNSLQSGNVVLAKIAQEVNKPVVQSQSSVNATPVEFSQQTPVSPVVPNLQDNNVMGSVDGATLPPLFGI